MGKTITVRHSVKKGKWDSSIWRSTSREDHKYLFRVGEGESITSLERLSKFAEYNTQLITDSLGLARTHGGREEKVLVKSKCK